MTDGKTGVGRGTHTAAPAGAPEADLFEAPLLGQMRAPNSRAGRPNRFKAMQAAQIIAKGGDPLIETLRLGMANPVDLAKECAALARQTGLEAGFTVRDLLRFKLDCLATALPYLHAKQAPVAPSGEAVRPVIAFMNMGASQIANPSGAIDGQAMVIDMAALAFEENQGLGDERAIAPDGQAGASPDYASDNRRMEE